MTAPPRRIPLEDFFRKPERVSVRLSLGGRYLAYLEPFERRLNVTVRDLQTGEVRRVTSDTERDIQGFVWANDERIVYARDRGGDENFRLFAVGRDGSRPVDLTPFDGVKCGIVDDLEEVDSEILFQMNRRDPKVFDVFRIDVNTGEMRLSAENPGNVQQWITDHAGRLRLATTTDGVNTSILYRERESEPWRNVATYNFKESAAPVGFDFDDRSIHVLSNVGRDRAALFRYDVGQGREDRLLFEHPEVDVAGILTSKRRKTVTGAVFETERVGYRFFDSERAALQDLLDRELPGRDNQVVSHSRDESRYVVFSGSDRGRGGYWLVDAPARRLEHLFDLSPWLREEEMAPMGPVSYPARDGLKIPGYLTLPVGRPPRGLPLVVNPHGGPWHRDSWGFDPEVQFLANRGFAVLQMNFRGSTGYGRRFLEAGYGEWGLGMQDDVTAGVEWAVREGIVDPARVAIYGGSYGGYAALSGLTKTPGLFRCGVSYVGVSNLFTWMAAIPPYWKPYLEMMYEMVGHPERDAERLRRTSPYFQADRIRVPLLVAQGANDPRVRREESEQIVGALRDRGIPVEYLVKDDEGHGFHNEENQFEFYRALEKFLLRHLGGDGA
ncbi:MAG: S9 family peptidase [Acidobacteria bacterium]|nr:S9 family peptidase [Acidobacteriota bacterium]